MLAAVCWSDFGRPLCAQLFSLVFPTFSALAGQNSWFFQCFSLGQPWLRSLGLLLGSLVRSCGVRGRILVGSWAILVPSWSFFVPLWPLPKTCVFLWFFISWALMGSFFVFSWACWALWGSPWGLLGRSWGSLWASPGPSCLCVVLIPFFA